ncbi:MAG: SRPBCC family protein [Sediminibacterium sp.]|nr:SRPBCC family protein [Sediminibacterium sp.]
METKKTKITVECVINAPLEKVWESRTLPQHIVNWNFASPDWHCPKAENDLREGGRFVSTMAAKDGSFSFDFSGHYTKVAPLKQIHYTMDDGRTSEVSFDSVNGQTKLTECFEAEQQNPEELQKQGWQAILNNFKAYTETL